MPKININGVTREMTPEELAELERLQKEMLLPLDPTEARMDEIEMALMELAAMLSGGGE